MTTYIPKDIDHSHEDDSSAFTMLGAGVLVVTLVVFALFVLQALPDNDAMADQGIDLTAMPEGGL